MKDGLDAQTYLDQFHNYDKYEEHDGSPYLEWWEIPEKTQTTTKPNIQSNSLKDIAGV